MSCDGLASHLGGVAILSVASFHTVRSRITSGSCFTEQYSKLNRTYWPVYFLNCTPQTISYQTKAQC